MNDPVDPYRDAEPAPTTQQPPARQPFAPEQPLPPQRYSAPPVPSTPPTVAYPAVGYPPVSGGPGQLPAPYSPPAAADGPPGYATPGADPATGYPLSDKSKVVAGLLQLLLGFMFSLGGVGRLYAGHTTLGVIQLVSSVVGWLAFWCGFFVLFLSWPIWIGLWLWFVIDGIVLLTGRPVDGEGRPLRT